MWGSWRWALVSPDGVAPSWMVGVSSSVNLCLHHEVQKFSSGTSSLGWSRKKGRKTVIMVVRWVQHSVTEVVTCVWKVFKLLAKASHNRSVAETKCNERSSRSHSVFRLHLAGRNSLTEETCTGQTALHSSDAECLNITRVTNCMQVRLWFPLYRKFRNFVVVEGKWHFLLPNRIEMSVSGAVLSWRLPESLSAQSTTSSLSHGLSPGIA